MDTDTGWSEGEQTQARGPLEGMSSDSEFPSPEFGSDPASDGDGVTLSANL